MRDENGARIAGLLAEVESLGNIIRELRAEVSILRVQDITLREIPSATDELDAAVLHTAEAANAILESCEMLDALLPTLHGLQAESLQAATTRIYEACCFQDITGQRITKVVATLKTIEAKVSAIIAAFGPGIVAAPEPDRPLMDGPQHPAIALDQSDVDRLFASAE